MLRQDGARRSPPGRMRSARLASTQRWGFSPNTQASPWLRSLAALPYRMGLWRLLMMITTINTDIHPAAAS
ncbi:hypothetical protein NQZ68_022125 [Dissostichus eleginoides]|nr:hypothetical protein NQZ68_022125 [Dissostichus eleginoides]